MALSHFTSIDLTGTDGTQYKQGTQSAQIHPECRTSIQCKTGVQSAQITQTAIPALSCRAKAPAQGR